MKKSKSRITIISVAVAILIIVFSIPWFAYHVEMWLLPDPLKPQITSGEFPFELVYTLEGETVTVNDAFVCEYDGIGTDKGIGKHIKWKSYIKSSNQENLVLLDKNNKRIVCTIGEPDYYMGNPEHNTQDVIPNLILFEDYGDITTSHSLSEKEKKEYKIKLISWKFSKPIENKFE